jgi:SAM-dependent methyltransferase
MFPPPARWLAQSLKQRGVVQTVAVGVSVIADVAFDLRHGTDTLKWVPLTDLEIASSNKGFGVWYQASKARPLVKLLRLLNLPKDGAFVDFGSGKGRVLLIAAALGFSCVVGVEFSAELCAIARKNVAAFSRRTRVSSSIEVVESDAAEFQISREQNVFFMYNPFEEIVIEQVLHNLADSVKNFPRPVWLIYNTPLHSDAINRSELFKKRQRYRIRGNDFEVFSS